MLSILHASRHHRKLRMRSWCTELCIFSSVFSICCTIYQHMLLMKRQLRVLSLIPALICLHGVRAPSDADLPSVALIRYSLRVLLATTRELHSAGFFSSQNVWIRTPLFTHSFSTNCSLIVIWLWTQSCVCFSPTHYADFCMWHAEAKDSWIKPPRRLIKICLRFIRIVIDLFPTPQTRNSLLSDSLPAKIL